MIQYRNLLNFLGSASVIGLACGPHITRYSMYSRLRSLGSILPHRKGRTLSISHSENLDNLLGLESSEIVLADYPDHDLIALNFPDGAFDYVLSDQVLEHVEGNPQQAIDECYRVLRPGGVAVHTTCFINPIHGDPKDFWRFTPNALSLLHRRWSEIIEVGGWGNPAAWLAVGIGLRFVGVPHATWHPLHQLATKNNPRWPISTWIIARK
jgi:SAM-dependent methyltransferase